MGWIVGNHGACGVVALAAPPGNDISLRLLGELESVLLEIARDEKIKLVVLTGDPPGSYLGHADLADIAAVRARQAGPDPFERWLLTPLVLEDIPQPVIAAIDGPARGGGSELALACTFRVGSTAASFTQHEVTRNAMPGAGATQRLPRIIGPSRAARVLMTGETIEASEALRLGLLDHIVSDGDFLQSVLEWAEPIARHERSALTAIKRALVNGSRRGGLDGLMLEHQLFHRLVQQEQT